MIDLISPTSRNVDLSFLHPIFRDAIERLKNELEDAEIPLVIFEAYRTPVRQAYLYAQGRTTKGPIVTYAKPWYSYHQYGLAVDMVFGGPGKWTWSEPKKGMWKKYHELAKKNGLTPLSFETPHVQLGETSSNALSEGRYPDGGDANWAENLASAISSWHGTPPAPPLPNIFEKAPVT
ncbi:M15 family metallopeptidase [Rhizobium sp. FKL33]|uniref:M15 family metallopeptidase n=1 Tax=Rhizobium sp. FKL33 TaxID=2562307 RepID=UPI0010C04AB1|nr:M15 family metallopeptidase [Rhizobium sp. FKL33]